MARIIVSVINDLETDQRVDKVCSTLHESGHDLLLVGRRTKFSGQLNRKYAFKRMRLLFSKGPLFYAEFNFRLFLLLLFVKAEVLLSNDLDTLLANYLASRIRRKELVYDSHEYFTEVPELRGRFAKSIWERIEKWIFPKLRNVYTVNGSLAKIYADKYNVDVKVVQNLPRNLVSENNFEREYLLYQGAINVGRGLEEIVSAMEKIAVPLIIVGEGDIKQSLKALIQEKGLEDRITLMDRVSPDKLRELTLRAKIGFNLLEDASFNLGSSFSQINSFLAAFICFNF